MTQGFGRAFRITVAAMALGGLAGCDMLGIGQPPAVSAAQTIPNTPPDSRGVITYATYQVVVAREGDTVAGVAQRLGITTEQLSSLNGLPSGYRLRTGEVLVLPDTVPRPPEGFATGAVETSTLGWSPERVAGAIDSAPSGSAAPSATPPASNPFTGGQTEPLIDPVRHRVESGETAYSIARLYGVSVTALGSWNGLGPDLAVRENQELLIPIVSGANQIIGAGDDTQPGQGTPAPLPPSSAAPLPSNIVAGAIPASPGLDQYRTPQGGRLSPPVSAAITKPYNPAPGPNRSEGVGYAVPAGTPVSAAGDGEIALVSESLDGLGTIVLIRHGDDLMTVYGRVANVTVDRGQTVTAGQPIGSVAPGENPELHFEVRRGTSSVDPMPYIGG